MAKYRQKKPIIGAMRVSEVLKLAKENWNSLPQWFREAYEQGQVIILPAEVKIKCIFPLLYDWYSLQAPDSWIVENFMELEHYSNTQFWQKFELIDLEGE